MGMYSVFTTVGLIFALFSNNSKYIIGILGNVFGRKEGLSVGTFTTVTDGAFLDIQIFYLTPVEL